jgi:hypothetical protein
MKKSFCAISCIIAICGLRISTVVGWENEFTHPALTEEAVERSVLAGDYLQMQLGLEAKLDTEVELLSSVRSDLQTRAGQCIPPATWNTTKTSLTEWLKDDSFFEDAPTVRARHHFHDPLRDAGLYNWAYGSAWLAKKLSAKDFPDYEPFDPLARRCMVSAPWIPFDKDTYPDRMAVYDFRW